jgi:hypothetical protein
MKILWGGLGLPLGWQFGNQRRTQGSALELQVGTSKRAERRGVCVGALVLILLCATPGLRAQGVRYDNIVLGPRGGPVGAASIAVCAAGASTSTTPCSPLATIYSDEALTQPLANPFQADSLGNYGFWAAPGHYVVQIYGAGVTTRTMNVFLPCDPSNCSMSNATFSSITAGTLNLSGALTVNGRSVATEAKNTDAVLYVSPNGSDSNDGLSWGSAKQTLYAAVSAVENATVGGGTLYVAANTACGGPVAGQGLWLVGDNDSAHTSPPSGWIYAEWPLRIIGVGATTWYGNASGSAVNLNCGSGTTANEPGLWLSGTNRPFYFANLYFPLNYSSGLRMGIDTTGARNNNNSGATSVIFDNVQFGAEINSTSGPAVDIGNNVFWVWFKHSVFNADTSATALSDQHQGIVINPGPSGNCGHQDGLIYVDNSVVNGGGIHFYGTCESGGSLYVNGITTENQDDGSPAVWISSTVGNMPSGAYHINDVGVSDATVNPTYAVQVDNEGTTSIPNPDSTVVSEVGGNGQNVKGPMTVLSQTPQNLGNSGVDPDAEGQVGFQGGHVYGQVDTARRMFSPTAYPWPNLVNQVPSSWSAQAMTPGATTGTGPDGASQALDANNSTGASAAQVTFLNSGGISASSGDYFVFGFWWRLVSGAYYAGTAGNVTVSCGSGGAVNYLAGYGENIHPSFGASGIDNEWQWGWTVVKATTVVGGSCGVAFAGYVNADAHMQFFDPILIHIPVGQATDNEAAEFGANLANYPDSLTPPVEASPRGLPFAFGGSGDNSFAILDHTTLTANRTFDFPNASGTIALSGPAGVSAGTITLVSGAGSHTFSTAYSTAPVCVGSDTTSSAAVLVTSSTTAVSVSGTGTDVIAWICAPAVN